jgi:hypothetical protein
MATKKSNRKRSKKTPGRKATLKKRVKPVKKSSKKKPAPKKALKKKASSRKQAGKRKARRRAASFSTRGRGPRLGDQSGDLQGLSRREVADSESVDELLEEGNAFEADAVMGVEDAGNAEEREVHTREVPEDDVPGEYLDEQ